MEKVIEEYKRVMQENTDLKVQLLLKEQFNYQELQYEELSYHDFTEDELVTFKKLLMKHIFEVEYEYHGTSRLNPLLNKLNNILTSKYG